MVEGVEAQRSPTTPSTRTRTFQPASLDQSRFIGPELPGGRSPTSPAVSLGELSLEELVARACCKHIEADRTSGRVAPLLRLGIADEGLDRADDEASGSARGFLELAFGMFV